VCPAWDDSARSHETPTPPTPPQTIVFFTSLALENGGLLYDGGQARSNRCGEGHFLSGSESHGEFTLIGWIYELCDLLAWRYGVSAIPFRVWLDPFLQLRVL